MKEFRRHHLLQIINSYKTSQAPLDVVICKYFRANKSLGSKDRAYISETIYKFFRWEMLIEHLVQESWDKKIDFLQTFEPANHLNDPSIPIHIRLSCPIFLYQQIVNYLGEEKAKEICLVNNQMAPTTVRVNILKISRDELFQRWKKLYDVSLTQQSETGITFHKKIHFFSLPEFKAGLFEIQDEGSQVLAEMMNVKPREQVLDYCAGSGGKSLAFAHKLQGSGQMYLHDIRQHALLEAKQRLKRAGIQNAQIISADATHLKKLKKQMDWVLVDAPCSGSGTLRRNPDMKKKFSEELLQRLVTEQRLIFEKALSYVKIGGHIVYATCSILDIENQKQVEYFLQKYPVKLCKPVFQSFPESGKMDGFFGACFIKEESALP